jgi:hypothetical protein
MTQKDRDRLVVLKQAHQRQQSRWDAANGLRGVCSRG